MQLTEREKNNPQYEFLKPGDKLFKYFMQLVAAYKNCFYLSKREIKRLRNNLKNKMSIYNRAYRIYEYKTMLKKQKKENEQLVKQEEKI